ncbi:MAG: M20/M25/M40 family metallo-hydrolase, partial [Anaerolineae bacterium]|nr:M20/M25/M40 family metallo-hydrolase [Anaerolineae bacterium]
MAFARIPSVSTDPGYAADMQRAGEWVADQMTGAGLANVRLIPTDRHPVVYGEWMQAPGAPTILIYGHYDVQPPDPLDKWLSPPFEPEIRNGRLYGRGVSDDKGPLFVAIKAAQAFLATTGRLPINVKFMIEGEEEIGSPSLESFIRNQAPLLAADFVLSADGAMWRIDEPSITVSSRGMTGLELTLRGPGKDLHSGRHGGGVANPLHALAELIASLHTADGRVAVAGFYDSVVGVPPEERRAIMSLPFDEAAYTRAVGASELVGEPGYTTLERQWIRPTLEVNGLWGG